MSQKNLSFAHVLVSSRTPCYCYRMPKWLPPWKLDRYVGVVEEVEQFLEDYVEWAATNTQTTQFALSPFEQARLTYKYWSQPLSLSRLADQHNLTVSTVSRTIERVEAWVIKRIKERRWRRKSTVPLPHIAYGWPKKTFRLPKKIILLRLHKTRYERSRARREVKQKRGRPKALNSSLYEKVLKYNRQHGLTVKEACEKAGVSKSAFYRYRRSQNCS